MALKHTMVDQWNLPDVLVAKHLPDGCHQFLLLHMLLIYSKHILTRWLLLYNCFSISSKVSNMYCWQPVAAWAQQWQGVCAFP